MTGVSGDTAGVDSWAYLATPNRSVHGQKWTVPGDSTSDPPYTYPYLRLS